MPSQLNGAVAECGFVFLPAHEATLSSAIVSAQLGSVAQLAGVEEVQTLMPRERTESPPNIYSGNYGYGAFPLHTDLAHWYLPPRYLVLRCISGAAEVSTRLLDCSALIAAIGVADLRRAVVQPRRPLDGKRPLLRLLERDGRQAVSRIRWDTLFLRPATESSRTIWEAAKTYLDGARPISVELKHRGDTLLVDNWRMLHGRSAVPRTGEFRRIERVYLGGLY